LPSSLSLIWTITAGATLLQAANGLFQALLPLRMRADGLSITAIGMVAAAYGFGFAVGCFGAPAFVRHVGHIRAFASLAAVAAVVSLAFTQADSVMAWAVLRALSGATLAGLFTVIDGWISARATASHRGRILSIYMVCTKVALMLSPFGIALGDIRADGLFMVVSAMMCLSLLPISATITEEPPGPRIVRVDVRGLFRTAPSAVVGAFTVGLVNGPVIAIAPVYGVAIGLSADEAAALLFALQGGSLLMQWPMGWLSDHSDRRRVIAGLAAGTTLVSILILLSSASAEPLLVILAFGAWGGLALCVYSVCVAHACDLVEPERIVPTISGLLVSWAAGVTLGPIPGSLMMERFGPGGLFVYAAAMSSLLTLFVVIRIVQQPRGAHKGGFVDLSPSSGATGSLSPRADLPQAVEAGAVEVEPASAARAKA
jgi:predicted MFS family arabinose efflux permease